MILYLGWTLGGWCSARGQAQTAERSEDGEVRGQAGVISLSNEECYMWIWRTYLCKQLIISNQRIITEHAEHDLLQLEIMLIC